MNYIAKHPQPQCCKDCPEISVEICFHCEHFREKFEVLDSEYAEEQLRRQLLRKLLKVERDEDYFVVRWKPISCRPVNATYVLLKERDDEFGVVTWLANYENERFSYYGGGAYSDEVDESKILGWDYLPYDEHWDRATDERFEAFMKNMGKLIREKLEPQSQEESSDGENAPDKT